MIDLLLGALFVIAYWRTGAHSERRNWYARQLEEESRMPPTTAHQP
jgi:hypothetical protein